MPLRESSRESDLQWQSCITSVRADALKRAAQQDVRPQMDNLEPSKQSFLRRLGWLALGISLTVIGSFVLRVWYYEAAGLQPNMAPQMAYYFAPLFIVVLVVVAAVVEAVLSKFWFVVSGPAGNIVLGLSYGSCVIALLGASAAVVFLVTNPVVVRVVMRRLYRHGTSAV